MHSIALIRIPGNGQTTVSVADGTTWQQFVDANNLQDKVLYAQGLQVTDLTGFVGPFPGLTQVLATAAVKGA